MPNTKSSGGFFLAFDVDRIQRTIFESNWLPIVRAGIRLLAELICEKNVRTVLPDITDQPSDAVDVVFADGGSGLLKFFGPCSVSPRQVEERLQCWFACKTKFASMTTATVPMDVSWKGSPRGLEGVPRFDEIPGGAFARVFRRLSILLDERKRSKVTATDLDLPAWVTVCSSCGARPATETVPRAGEDAHVLCLPCSARYESEGPTLDDIKDENGSIGLVYLDGNGVGRLREKTCEYGEAGLRAFAKAMREIVEAGLEEVANERIAPKDRLIALSLGGDDVAVVVGGRQALRVLYAFEQAVKREVSNKDGFPKLAFSAGVVVAPVHTPIPFLYRYAEDLCHSAKHLWASSGTGEWTCDIALLTGSSPLAADIETVRRDSLTVERRDEPLRLTGAPWTLEKVWEISEAVRQLDECRVSVSALRQLVEACRTMDRTESTAFVRAQWARDPALRRWLSNILPRWDTWPWRLSGRPGGTYETDLPEIARWHGRLRPIDRGGGP